MNAVSTIHPATKLLQERTASPAEALRVFDELEPASLDFLKGRWRGFEIATGHPLDGLLQPSGWYGKLFNGKDDVHPLLFYTRDRSALYSVDPKSIPLTLKIPKSAPIGLLMALSRPLLQTRAPKARIRLVEFRGKLTATMIYDAKPIFDHFAKVDDRTLLGVMDLKGIPAPYVFVLERADESPIPLHL
jgi:hypothetical protein